MNDYQRRVAVLWALAGKDERTAVLAWEWCREHRYGITLAEVCRELVRLESGQLAREAPGKAGRWNITPKGREWLRHHG